MMRTHGTPPFTTAVVHGGPGAKGSLYFLAKELSAYTGVLEPIQTQYTPQALTEELKEQLTPFAQTPLVGVGHSWGAWLLLLTTRQYPQIFKKLILIGCPPLTPQYATQIEERRLENLPLPLAKRYVHALKTLHQGPPEAQGAALQELGALCERADNVDPLDLGPDPDGLQPDEKAFSHVWPLAQELRQNGDLLKALRQLALPVTLIQGQQDPHPAQGVYEPFAQCAKPLTVHILPACGHSPFAERQAKGTFYTLLRKLILEN